MSFIFVLFMLLLLTVCALYVCLCDYVNMCMYLVLLCIFGKKLLRACVYCLQKPNSNKVFLSYLILLMRYCFPLLGYTYYCAFVWVEVHEPVLFPFTCSIEVLLEFYCIFFVFYLFVYEKINNK